MFRSCFSYYLIIPWVPVFYSGCFVYPHPHHWIYAGFPVKEIIYPHPYGVSNMVQHEFIAFSFDSGMKKAPSVVAESLSFRVLQLNLGFVADLTGSCYPPSDAKPESAVNVQTCILGRPEVRDANIAQPVLHSDCSLRSGLVPSVIAREPESSAGFPGLVERH